MTGTKILLVDDEVVFTRNMKRLLAHRGYRVTTVNSGRSAIRALKEQGFDVIVLDLKMPDMDGITTLEEIRKLDLLAMVLILTGIGSMDATVKAMEIGAYDCVMKPCEVSELVSKIEAAHESKRSREHQAGFS